jgi:hypothetical protein
MFCAFTYKHYDIGTHACKVIRSTVVALDKFAYHLIYRSVTFDSHLTTEDVFLTATASLSLSWQYLPSIITETSVGKEIAFGDLPIPHFTNNMSKCTIINSNNIYIFLHSSSESWMHNLVHLTMLLMWQVFQHCPHPFLNGWKRNANHRYWI